MTHIKKYYWEIITFLLLTKSLQSSVYITLIAHLNLGAKFSLEILNLNLDFIKLTGEKLDSRTKLFKYT